MKNVIIIYKELELIPPLTGKRGHYWHHNLPTALFRDSIRVRHPVSQAINDIEVTHSSHTA